MILVLATEPLSPIFLAAAVIGGVGGAIGAFWALRAKHWRLLVETAQTPVFERYYSMLLDHVMFFGLRGCRFALYRDFLVIRGPALAITLTYDQIQEVFGTKVLMRPAVVIRSINSPAAKHLAIFCGPEVHRIINIVLGLQREAMSAQNGNV